MFTNTSESRLVDYYFVVSCSDHGKEQTKRRLCRQSLAPPHEKEARHALFALKPKIVDRYPTRNYHDTPLLPWVARASMPRGVRARTIPPAPRYFTFTGWNVDGSKLYGACLEVFEKMDIKKQRQPVYIPKTLGFLSHYPYFYAFDVFLRCLWHVIPKKLIRLEDLLMHYFYDIPAPLPRKKIAYDLGKMKVLLACRNEFDVPIMELPIETTFAQLSKDRICMILKLLLLEQRIAFVCTLVHELTPVCELFASLLFPLRWRHLFIPLVCKPMANALNNGRFKTRTTSHWDGHEDEDEDAENEEDDEDEDEDDMQKGYTRPFLLGLPRFVYIRPEIASSMPSDTYVVFLDRNDISNGAGELMEAWKNNVPKLPSPLEESLMDSIHALARVLTMPDGTVSRDVILSAFRTMFAVITKLLFIAHNTSQSDVEENPHTFVARFKRTNLFASFKAYYARINPSDSALKSIYPFFKQNEALGKHFARRSHSNSWSAGFDQSQYSRDAFRVNQDVLKRVEKQFAKKRADLANSTRNKIVSLPPEFEHLPAVRNFLRNHVFYGTSPPKTTTATASAAPRKAKEAGDSADKAAATATKVGKPHRVASKRKPSAKKRVDGASAQNGSKKDKASASSTATATATTVTNGALPSKNSGGGGKDDTVDSDDDEVANMDISNDKVMAVSAKDDQDDDDNDSDDDDSDDDDEDDDDDSDSDSGSDEDSDSWGSIEEGPVADVDEETAAAARHNRRFQNLNEFEFSMKEKQWMDACQKQHNSLLTNIGTEIKPLIGCDLFEENIIKSWKMLQRHSHKQQKRKI